MKKLMKSLILCALVTFVISLPTYAANTLNPEGRFIQITIVDADWSWSDDLTATGVGIFSIEYVPAATDEICVIKEGSDTGPMIFYVKSADTYDQRIKYFGRGLVRPVFDYSDSTNSAGGILIIELR